eukprot:3120715-Rhodomonas_salina.3
MQRSPTDVSPKGVSFWLGRQRLRSTSALPSDAAGRCFTPTAQTTSSESWGPVLAFRAAVTKEASCLRPSQL